MGYPEISLWDKVCGAPKKKKSLLQVYPQFEVPVTYRLLVCFFCFWLWNKVWQDPSS